MSAGEIADGSNAGPRAIIDASRSAKLRQLAQQNRARTTLMEDVWPWLPNERDFLCGILNLRQAARAASAKSSPRRKSLAESAGSNGELFGHRRFPSEAQKKLTEV